MSGSQIKIDAEADKTRAEIKTVAAAVLAIKTDTSNGEAIANIMLAYRHLEDASMRLEQVIKPFDGGVTVYDPAAPRSGVNRHGA